MNTILRPDEVNGSGIFRPAPLNGAFDQHLTAPHIFDAELRFVMPALGDEFYYALVNAQGEEPCNYNAALGPLVPKFDNEDYEALWVAHLYGLIGMAVYAESAPFLQTQAWSGGFVEIQAHEHKEAKTLDRVLDAAQTKIERRTAAMTDWLCERKATYPLFTKPCGCDDKSQNFHGFVFPKNKRKKRSYELGEHTDFCC